MKAPDSARARSREDWLLWVSLFSPVGAWIAAQQISFLLVPWICATGRRWVLYPVMAAAFLVAAAGAAVGWRSWKRLATKEESEDPVRARRQFMAAAALLGAAFFFVAILALTIPTFIHRPCD